MVNVLFNHLSQSDYIFLCLDGIIYIKELGFM